MKTKPIDTKSTTTAVAYLRASKDEQQLTIPQQRDEIMRWGVQNGVTISAYFEDQGVSGTVELSDRPGAIGLLTHLIENKVDYVVVQRRDRIARDAFIAAMFERHIGKTNKTRVVAISEDLGDETATQRLTNQILNAFAEFEVKMISARTKAALVQASKIRGYSASSRAFQFTQKGRDVLHWVAFGIVAEMTDSQIVGLLLDNNIKRQRRDKDGNETFLTRNNVKAVRTHFDKHPHLLQIALHETWEEAVHASDLVQEEGE